MAQAFNPIVWRARLEEMEMTPATEAQIQWRKQMDVLPATSRNRPGTIRRGSNLEIPASRLPLKIRSKASDKAKAAGRDKGRLKTKGKVRLPTAIIPAEATARVATSNRRTAMATMRNKPRQIISRTTKAKARTKPPVEIIRAGAIAVAIRSRRTTRKAKVRSAARRRGQAEMPAVATVCGNWRCNWAAATRAVRATTGRSREMNYVNWSDRLRDVEQVVDPADLRNQLATVRERASVLRADYRNADGSRMRTWSASRF